MKCTVLGCGSSLGVPRIGCNCSVCLSNDKMNIRSRPSIFLQHDGCNLLIDPGPDFRQQALCNNITRIDAAIITHAHIDHFGGLNDLKPLALHQDTIIPIYMSSHTFMSINQTYGYLFEKRSKFYNQVLEAICIDDDGYYDILNYNLYIFQQRHGELKSFGIRIGDFAYCTDVEEYSAQEISILQGVTTLIIDCLRYTDTPTHLSLNQALSYIKMINPKHAWLTHMDHDLDYQILCSTLPEFIRPAFDNLVIECRQKSH